jgi:excinuclease ABC subunit C
MHRYSKYASFLAPLAQTKWSIVRQLESREHFGFTGAAIQRHRQRTVARGVSGFLCTAGGFHAPDSHKQLVSEVATDRWQKLRPQIATLPRSCGVYLFRDRRGRLLYVGKSRCLQDRVASYFRNKQTEARPRQVLAALDAVHRIEYFVTANEVEALAVESNFIHEHQPPYNTRLKDDRRFPFVRVTWSETYPRLVVTRQRPRVHRSSQGRDRVYGPFLDGKLLRRVLRFVQQNFPMRQRAQPLFRDRPCLNYDIGLCPGVCQKRIDPVAYRETVRKAELCLQGRVTDVICQLKAEMQAVVKREDYERAANLRDACRALERLANEVTSDVIPHTTQRVLLAEDSLSADIVAAAITPDARAASVEFIQMRDGMVINRLHFDLQVSPLLRDLELHQQQSEKERLNQLAGSILQQALVEHYSSISNAGEMPDEVLVYPTLPDPSSLEKLLWELWRPRSVRVLTPENGLRWELTLLAQKNAVAQLAKTHLRAEDAVAPLEDLAAKLGLLHRPYRLECFDISHLGGRFTVASQSVFLDGIPAPYAYRRYRIRQSSERTASSNDLQSIQQVLRRRFRQRQKSPVDIPDIVLVDGGLEQLKAACNALEACGLKPRAGTPVLLALAKKNEEIYTLGSNEPLEHSRSDAPDSPALRLLRHMRDEAHNFAVQYHRRLRSKAAMASALDGVPGLGPTRKNVLLQHFGSFEGVAMADMEQLSTVPQIGPMLAERIYGHLHGIDKD